MRKSYLLLIIALLFPVAGCRPAGKMLASIQYHNLKLRLAKSKMTMTVGDGRVDARKLMMQEVYAGKVVSGHVTAMYPEGLEDTARELAKQFDDFYPTIEKITGIECSFDLVLKLVRVDNSAQGYRYSLNLTKNRVLTFPIPVYRDSANGVWTSVIAHEMTESSMLAPRKRGNLLLADLYSGQFCLPTYTRWFRDGVSDYAQHVFYAALTGGEALPPAESYAELNRLKTQILCWTNCEGQPNWYNASAALVFEITNRYGEDAICRMTAELSKQSMPDGLGLKRAFKQATGDDLVEFLKTYETPWIGCSVRSDRSGRVVVTRVYPATPASRRGIAVDDVIVSFAGRTVKSPDEFASILARQKPWQMVSIEVDRNGERLPMRLKLIPRPTDMSMFLKLSGIK